MLGLGHNKGQSETNCNRHVSLISIKIKMWFFIFSFKKAFLTCFGNFYRILLAIVMQRSLSPSNFFICELGPKRRLCRPRSENDGQHSLFEEFWRISLYLAMAVLRQIEGNGQISSLRAKQWRHLLNFLTVWYGRAGQQ